MVLHVNGRTMTFPEGLTVAGLLTALNAGERRVAVEVNRELVVRKQWEGTVLRAGDHVEIVTFVGGG
jgi:sulfur carrier protein